MLPALFLPVLFAAQAPPPPPAVTDPAAPAVDPAVAELNQRIKGLEAAQNWAEVIRTIEALGPEERAARLKAWTWALFNTGQHARVLAILDDPAHRERAKVDPLPQFKARALVALFNRGRASMGLRHFKEARDDYQAVLALNPGNPALVTYLQKELKLADDSLGRP